MYVLSARGKWREYLSSRSVNARDFSESLLIIIRKFNNYISVV